MIDDASDVRTLIGRSLERAKHQVALASSTDEGVAQLRLKKFDLVLLDLEMPVKDGIACLSIIRHDAALARTPVIMVTGTPLREVLLRVVQLGIQGIVIKKDNWIPVLMDQIAKLLAAAPAAAPAAASTAIRSAAAPASRGARAPSETPAMASGTPRHVAPPVPPPTPGATIGQPTAPKAPHPADALALEPWMSPVVNVDAPPPTSEQALEMLKALKPMIARSELLETMLTETVSARAIKPAVQQVLRLTERADSSVQAIAGAIRQDQALSLRILKMANSALYAHGDSVDTVSKAVSRIGLAQIRDVVLGVAVLDAFGKASVHGSFRPEWFWEHGAACGLLATRLSQACGRPKEHCDTMFTAGLLHDLGRLLFAEHLPEHYPKVIQTAEHLELPLEIVESRLLLLNHADITDRLLHHWKFPPTLIAPVAMHHMSLGNIKQTAPRLADDIVPLALANRLAHAMLAGSSGNEVLYPLEDLVEHLRIDDRVLAQLCIKAHDELADLRVNMLMHSSESTRSYIDDVRERLGDVRPLTLATHPDTDPMSIMARALSGGIAPIAPNIITLRVRAPNDRVACMRLLQDATESTAKGALPGNLLPVLVVGNSKACLFADGTLGDRLVRQVTLPLGLNRLIRQMRELTGIQSVSAQAA